MTSIFPSILTPAYLNLLLVKDCPEDTELIQNTLLESNLRVSINFTHVIRLQEAIENLINQVFDVILLDISLSDSQSFDIFLRLQNYSINIPIVILTAADEEALAIELIAAGAQDYLVKGQLDSRLLMRTLQCAIVRHKRQAEGQNNRDKILVQDQLKASNFFLNYTISAVVENIPGAVYRCHYDVHWTMEFISDEIEGISGYSAGDFMCKSKFCFASIIHEADTEMVDRQVKAAVVSKQPYYLEYRIVCADGATRWISERGRPAYNAEGQILWLDGVIFDITDRKQAELTLQQVTQAVDSASDAIAIANLEGYSIYHNLAFIQRYGYTVEQLNNSGGPAVIYTKYQELRKLFIVLRKGLSWSGEIQLKAKNGEIIEAQLRADCIKNSNNQPIGMMVIIADLTELKRTESALKLSQERLQLAVFGSSLGLWDWNIATGETYFDSQWKAMLGYEENEIQNSVKSWEDLLHPEDKLIVMDALHLNFEGKTNIYQVEFRMLNKSGNWQWIMALGKVVEYDEWGAPLRMNGTHQDLTLF